MYRPKVRKKTARSELFERLVGHYPKRQRRDRFFVEKFRGISGNLCHCMTVFGHAVFCVCSALYFVERNCEDTASPKTRMQWHKKTPSTLRFLSSTLSAFPRFPYFAKISSGSCRLGSNQDWQIWPVVNRNTKTLGCLRGACYPDCLL